MISQRPTCQSLQLSRTLPILPALFPLLHCNFSVFRLVGLVLDPLKQSPEQCASPFAQHVTLQPKEYDYAQPSCSAFV